MSRSIEIHTEQSLLQKIIHLNWGLVILVTMVAGLGLTALYSAAGGAMDPWASRQAMRFVVGLAGMFVVALIDVRWWFKLAWPIYFLGLAMLLAVEIMGHIGMGAQRWINLGFIQLQPSELMKIAVVMVLARYFHSRSAEDMRHLTTLVIPALVIFAPVGLVLLQPDLGTSLMIVMAGVAVTFTAGAPWWLFAGGIVASVASIPVAWMFMHDYQKQRVLTFLHPESDPLGAGYHITQSKIAIGSGGIEGKGFLGGSQSHLNFLPEKQTDFIFTLWVEEWGLLGGVFLLALMGAIFLYCAWIAFRCRHMFGRLMAFGLMVNFSLYVFINIAMVMGLIPVVGAPLPMISYGGTSMLAALAGFGLIMSCGIHREAKLVRM